MKKEPFFRKSNPLLWLLLIQAVLTVLAFPQFFVSPNDFMFSDKGDSIKNYFTFQAYLQQPYSISNLKLMQQGYPYGDSIFYADLIPIVAVPLKWFCSYIYDVSVYGVGILNMLCLFLQFILVVPIYKLLQKFLKTTWLITLLSISFSWGYPQITNLVVGHFSLLTPIFFLYNILLVIKVFEEFQERGEVRWLHCLQWGGLVFIAGFTHLYYFAILLTANLVFILTIGAIVIYKKNKKLSDLIRGVLMLGGTQMATFFLVIIIIIGSDPDYANRTQADLGYGWIMLNTQLEALYTARDYFSINFLCSYKGPIGTNLYLGNFVLYSLFWIFFIRIALKSYSISFSILIQPYRAIIKVLFFLSCVVFFISIGERYFLTEDFILTNYFNLFFYIRKITSKVEHFRVLARFFWLTYWIWVFLVAYLVDQYWQKTEFKLIKVLIAIVSILAIVDTIDTVKWLRQDIGVKSVFNKKNIVSNYPELKDVNYKAYQAVLSLPYFNLGTEVKGYHLYASDNVYKLSYGVSIAQNIPLLCISASRLTLKETIDRFSIFSNPTSRFLSNVSSRPILVMKLKENSYEQQDEPAKSISLNSFNIIAKYNMKKIGEGQKLEIYEWNLVEQK